MNPYDILDKDNLQKVANAGITIENRKYSEEELKIFSHNILDYIMNHSSKTGEIGKLYNEYDYILKTFGV